MERRASHLSLDGMPAELISLIAPNPFASRPAGALRGDLRRSKWMILNTRYSSYLERVDLNTLRALSWTSQRLRAIVLPRLWSAIQITTVYELGLLRDALRTSKHLAPLIHRFYFAWNMNHDYLDCELYPEEHGSPLDMAFVDRGAIWRTMHQELGLEVEFPGLEFNQLNQPSEAVFHHNGTTYIEPGGPYEWEAHREGDPSPGLGLRSSGPDGSGPDLRITNPEELISCLVEVVSQLPSLRGFSWSTPMAMPTGVFEALLRADQLTALHITLYGTRRSSFSNVPLWNLTSQLEYLSIARYSNAGVADRDVRLEALSEEDLLSVELPSDPSSESLDDASIRDVLDRIASRAVFAAAQGQKLRRLFLHQGDLKYGLWKPLAVPSAIPRWVQIDEWDKYRMSTRVSTFLEAAGMLRLALFHTSLRGKHAPATPSGGSVRDRMLTRAEVQAMYNTFQQHKLPVRDFLRPISLGLSIVVNPGSWAEGDRLEVGTGIELYLRWIRDDAELAHEDTEAWNEVGLRGAADLIKCYCRTCCKSGKPGGRRPF